ETPSSSPCANTILIGQKLPRRWASAVARCCTSSIDCENWDSKSICRRRAPFPIIELRKEFPKTAAFAVTPLVPRSFSEGGKWLCPPETNPLFVETALIDPLFWVRFPKRTHLQIGPANDLST